MKALYEPIKKHLIIIPLRCGSTVLEDNAEKYNLSVITNKIPHSYYQENQPIGNVAPLLEIIQGAYKKTFLFKEPFERLVSTYRNFVYVPYFSGNENGLTERFKLFWPTKRKQDFWDDITEAQELIQLNYKKDPHTVPQYSFFKLFNQRAEDYEIINADQIQKWIYLNFGDTIQNRISPIYEIPIKFSSIAKIQKIHDICKVLYKEDYEYLEPNVKYI